MSAATERTVEHAVTPLELFFDLVFVFAITQVTSLLTREPTWHGLVRGALALAAVWWAWTGYAWLTSTLDVDAAGFVGGEARIVIWIVALAIDYCGPAVVALHGWRIAPEHFAERYGLVVLIALGESIVAIGVGAGLTLGAGVIGGAVLGLVVVSALWWLYFDVAAIFARRELVRASGAAQARLARDAYSYLHLPMVGGIVFFAFGLEATLHHVGHTLAALPAVAVCVGAALYLLAHVAFLWRTTGRIFRRRTLGTVVLLALVPAALVLPGIAALALVSAVCSFVVAYEAIRYRTHRVQIRHPELSG